MSSSSAVRHHSFWGPRQQFVCFFNIATVYLPLAEPDKAFEALERGYNDRTG